MKISAKYLAPAALAGLLTLTPPDAKGIDVSTATYLPNNHGKSLTTPVAWGAANNVIFMGVGGTSPAPYTHDADGAAVLGFGVGDPKENLGLQVALVNLDISAWDRYSMAVQLHRQLDNANAIAVGVENVMLSSGGDADKSFYIVYSQGVQADPFVNDVTGNSKLHFSIGAGTGRFGDKSPDDIAHGRGEHGTYVFGNIAYDVAESFNLIADWNGLNLNVGASKTFKAGNVPFAITIGAADLTRNSGDKVRFIGACGLAFKL